MLTRKRNKLLRIWDFNWVAARRSSSPLPFYHINYTCSACGFIRTYSYYI